MENALRKTNDFALGVMWLDDFIKKAAPRGRRSIETIRRLLVRSFDAGLKIETEMADFTFGIDNVTVTPGISITVTDDSLGQSTWIHMTIRKIHRRSLRVIGIKHYGGPSRHLESAADVISYLAMDAESIERRNQKRKDQAS